MGYLETVNMLLLVVLLADAASLRPSSGGLRNKWEVQEAWLHRSRRLLQTPGGSGTFASDMTDSWSSDPTLTSDNSSTTRILANGGHKTPPITPSASSGSQSSKLVEILAGTLIAMIVVVLGFIVVVVVLILVLVKVNRRRKMDRELVLRTKQDIFEGIPSGVTPDELSSISKYNVDSMLATSPVKTSSTKGDEPAGEKAGLSGEGVNGSCGNGLAQSSST